MDFAVNGIIRQKSRGARGPMCPWPAIGVQPVATVPVCRPPSPEVPYVLFSGCGNAFEGLLTSAAQTEGLASGV